MFNFDFGTFHKTQNWSFNFKSGRILGAGVWSHPSCICPFLMEMLDLCRNLGFVNLEIESDFLQCVRLLNLSENVASAVGCVVDDIGVLSNCFSSCYVIHCKSEFKK